MAFKVNYNGYDFPATLRPMQQARSVDLGEQEVPRRAGSETQPGRIQARKLKISGTYINDDPDAFAAAMDLLLAACVGGSLAPAPLFFGRDDRYINAQCVEFPEDYAMGMQSGVGYSAQIDLSFTAADPFFYAALAGVPATPTVVGLNLDSATAIAPAGTADAAPVWSLTVGGSGGAGTITLTNSTTQETATISGTFNGNAVVTLDWLNYTAAMNGAADFSLLNGSIPSLPQGANSVSVAASGVSLSGASVAYTPRYL